MEAILKGHTRQEAGSRASRKLRAEGLIPAVLYGNGQAVENLSLEAQEVAQYFNVVKKRQCKLQLESKAIDVTIQDVQRHPISRDVLHIDFTRN